MPAPRKVACILTGNLDSVVAALLVKRKGYDATGVYIHNELLPKQLNDRLKKLAARAVSCLNMNFEEVHLPKEKWDNLKESAIKDCKDGLTPDIAFKYNNDIVCGAVLEHCLQNLGADIMATEHFARTSLSSRRAGSPVDGAERVKLYRGVDQLHDDSSLLAGLSQFHLQHLFLPLGDIAKDIVPKIAESAGLMTFTGDKGLRRKDFQEITNKALIKNLNPVPGKFLNVETLKEEKACDSIYEWKPGDVVEVDDQEFVVIEKNVENSSVYIARCQDHPALYCETFFTGLAHWLTEVPYDFYEKQMMNAAFKAGYFQPILKGTMTVGATNEYCGNDHIILSSSVPVKSIVPGTYATFYRGEEVLGCGKIFRRGPSLYAMNYKTYKQESPPHISKDSLLRNFVKKFTGS